MKKKGEIGNKNVKMKKNVKWKKSENWKNDKFEFKKSQNREENQNWRKEISKWINNVNF